MRFTARAVASIATLLMGLALLYPAYAQSGSDTSGTGGLHSIRGRIYLPNGRSPVNPIRVELQSTAQPTKFVYADRDGTFSFTSLGPGSYTVVVDAGDEFEIERESFLVEKESQGRVRLAAMPRIVNVPIYLKAKRSAKSLGRAEIINAKLSTAPKAAADLYESAQTAIARADRAAAIADLRKALNIFPAFALAWNDLGVLFETAGDQDQAIDAFRTAVKHDPEFAAAILNLGSALTQAGRYPEAEKYLAIALTMNPNSFRGHFHMGVTQSKLGRLDIAEQAFLQAIKLGGDQVSRAHYLLAGVYWAVKRYSEAAEELEKYLALDPNAKDAAKTRQSIIELRKKQG